MHGDTTGSERRGGGGGGGGCGLGGGVVTGLHRWHVCVRACACVMIGLDDALVTWAAVIGLHIDQFAALGGGQSPSWTCQMASHPPH